MHRLLRPGRPGILAVLAGACAAAALAMAIMLPVETASADSEARFRPVDNATIKAECGACHMAFPAGMLPAASWQKIMAGLPDHFGEDASLADPARRKITDWLVANAARPGSRLTRDMPADGTVLRITDTPWWVREHRGEVRPGAFEDPKVGSKANCAACHRDAARGNFDDD
jgi:hypothetical protein